VVLKEKKEILSFYLGFDCLGWVYIMGDVSWVLVFVVALVVECFGWERASEMVLFFFFFLYGVCYRVGRFPVSFLWF
jgi:NADH:ubiquinone oxidoreductase subunit 3 (subunit A)